LSSLINWIVRKIMSVFGVTFAAETSMLSAHEEIRGAVDLLHREGSVVKADGTGWAACSIWANSKCRM
jgi:Mg2+/Co2+ transporter CorB